MWLNIPECKTGPSQSGRLKKTYRIDLISLKRAYCYPCIAGYEIKVTRGDFKSDKKYPLYKLFCNQLYIACPHGLILPEEVPDGIGLVYSSKARKRIDEIKPAEYRYIDDPVAMLKYILISRTQITKSSLKLYEE